MRRVWRGIGAAVGALGLAAFAASFTANRASHGAAEIAMLSDRLFEFGATEFVHNGYAKDPARPGHKLFDCVMTGRVLTAVQSAQYRGHVQGWLLEKQSLFVRLDTDIELRTDAGMAQANNTGGHGIPGTHDHHDASFSRNAADISATLYTLAQAGALRRAALANDIYKDLTDLMVHLAPAIHSVGLLPEDADLMQALQSAPKGVLAFYSAMKTAQRADVNSDAYWRAVEDALDAYARIVSAVQSQVRGHNGTLLHALSGRWLAVQTIAPRLSASSPASARRKGDGRPCRV